MAAWSHRRMRPTPRTAQRPLLRRSPTTWWPAVSRENGRRRVRRPSQRRPPRHLRLRRRRSRRRRPTNLDRRAQLRLLRRRCRRPSSLPTCYRETLRSDHLLQAADLPLATFPLSSNHPTICVIDSLLAVGGFGRNVGRHHDIGATVVVPPFHSGGQGGALGRLGLGDLDQDFVVLVVILLGEIARRVG